MTLCWCGCAIDDKGLHLSYPDENGWGATYFVKDGDGIIEHRREKPQRGAPPPETLADTAK